YTQSQLAFEREVALPLTVTTMSELRGRLIAAMAESPDRAREALDTLNGVENSLKVYIGRQRALNDPKFTGKLATAEADLRQRTSQQDGATGPWRRVEGAVDAYRELCLPNRFLQPSSDLFAYAH